MGQVIFIPPLIRIVDEDPWLLATKGDGGYHYKLHNTHGHPRAETEATNFARAFRDVEHLNLLILNRSKMETKTNVTGN